MSNVDLFFSNGEKITNYLACAYAEGFCEGENASFEDSLRSWAHLIRTGLCWHLQGWYGRRATDFIEGGIISRDGIIDWDEVVSCQMMDE